MKTIYDVLSELRISYEKHEHPAVFTVEEAEHYDRDFNAGKSKNLFLRNKKGTTHYLLVAESNRNIDLKNVSAFLGESKLSFASPQRLLTHLGLTPGSVSPFGLVNNADKSIRVLIDKGLLAHKNVGFHPNINTATLVITTEDFKKFLASTGNKITYLDL